MTVIGIVGKPGNGKNCLATAEILRHVAYEKRKPQSQRRAIYANFPVYDRQYSPSEVAAGVAQVHPHVKRFDSWDEVRSLAQAVVFFDEAYRLFNAREWRDMKSDDIAQWTQHRKNGLTLYWMAQGVNQIESTIRLNVTAKIWSVIRVLGPAWDEGKTPLETLLGVWSIARLWDADKFETPTKARNLGARWLRIDRYWNHFDTTWTVANKQGAGGGAGAGLAALADSPPSTLGAVEVYKKWRVADEIFSRARVVRPCDLEDDDAVIAAIRGLTVAEDDPAAPSSTTSPAAKPGAVHFARGESDFFL